MMLRNRVDWKKVGMIREYAKLKMRWTDNWKEAIEEALEEFEVEKRKWRLYKEIIEELERGELKGAQYYFVRWGDEA